MNISAVGFDIDGTLYPPFALYRRLIPFTAANLPLMLSFQKTRKILHQEAGDYMGGGLPPRCGANAPTLPPSAGACPRNAPPPAGGGKDAVFAYNPPPISGIDFYKKQAALMASFLKIDTDQAGALIEERIYQNWTNLFTRIRPYRHAETSIKALQDAGYKLGILSDFPVREKLVNMRLAGSPPYWDACVCSEECGLLKPSTAGFLALAEKLNTPPDRILYVGNSYRFDIVGAARAGMKTALRADSRRRSYSPVQPDFVFSDYRELLKFILG